MGVINMMIVIPMLIQTLSFGPIFNFLLNNNPSTAIMVSGILFLTAGGCIIGKTKSIKNMSYAGQFQSEKNRVFYLHFKDHLNGIKTAYKHT